MSKMTGKEPEGMDEMLKNEALMKMLKEVNTTPQVSDSDRTHFVTPTSQLPLRNY
jgi:hypothetical protein